MLQLHQGIFISEIGNGFLVGIPVTYTNDQVDLMRVQASTMKDKFFGDEKLEALLNDGQPIPIERRLAEFGHDNIYFLASMDEVLKFIMYLRQEGETVSNALKKAQLSGIQEP